MSDYLVRGMSMDGFVKAVAIRSTELTRRGAEIQKTTPNATAAFAAHLAESYGLMPEYKSKFRRALALAKGETDEAV